MSETVTDRVRAQYTELPFPPANPDDERRRLISTSFVHGLDRISDFCFERGLTLGQGIRVLVAGCGTGDAVVYLGEQLRDTPSEIVSLDLSSTSLDIARQRCQLREIPNIHWLQGSLLELDKANVGTFDFIDCSGVLHHLEDPQAGLSALEKLLKPEGAMGLLVYGAHARKDIYQTQATLQAATVGMTRQEKIATARRFILEHPDSIPPETYQEVIGHDAALYDTLLHEQDEHPFTVPMVYNFLGGAGLRLAGFIDARFGSSFSYDFRRYMPPTTYSHVASDLPVIQQQAWAEKLSQKIYHHTFYAVKQTNNTQPIHPNMGRVPSFSIGISQELRARIAAIALNNAGAELRVAPIANGRDVAITLGRVATTLFRHLDGHLSLDDITSRGLSETNKSRYQFERKLSSLVHTLREAGWLTLRQPSVPSFMTSESIQHAQQVRQGTPEREVIVEDAIADIVRKSLVDI
jgi:2-polyprenyl-3-methyl-5-hydroxy-6-metoxy-1,4-benzoquinol methylase